MSILAEVKGILISVLQLKGDNAILQGDTPLLGAFPEFDSMAVVTILTALEERFGFYVDDDEISAQIFETVDSLIEFIETKI